MIGLPRVHHRLTDSTNERAKELALAGAPHGTVVSAGEQHAGRGRQGRAWVAPAGKAVLMSLIVRRPEDSFRLVPLAAAVAVCEACERSAPVACSIKWPNDVLIAQRKVAGVLIEGVPKHGFCILGIGLNVAMRADDFPISLRDRSTSLALAPALSSAERADAGAGAGAGANSSPARRPLTL